MFLFKCHRIYIPCPFLWQSNLPWTVCFCNQPITRATPTNYLTKLLKQFNRRRRIEKCTARQAEQFALPKPSYIHTLKTDFNFTKWFKTTSKNTILYAYIYQKKQMNNTKSWVGKFLLINAMAHHMSAQKHVVTSNVQRTEKISQIRILETDRWINSGLRMHIWHHVPQSPR